MIRFLIPFMAAAFLSSPAQAFTEDTGMFDGLQFVSETELAKPQGQALSLCHTTREFRIVGYTITSNPIDYVLSPDGCNAQIDDVLSTQQMEAAQSFDLIDASLPVEPENSQEQTARNVAPWALMALAMLFIIFRRLTSLAGGRQKATAQQSEPTDLDGDVLCRPFAWVGGRQGDFDHWPNRKTPDPTQFQTIRDHSYL